MNSDDEIHEDSMIGKRIGVYELRARDRARRNGRGLSGRAR